MALSATCTIVGLLAGSSTYVDPADAAADSGQLVEVTVTAQRHVENASIFQLNAISAYGRQFSPEPQRTFGITAGMHF